MRLSQRPVSVLIREDSPSGLHLEDSPSRVPLVAAAHLGVLLNVVGLGATSLLVSAVDPIVPAATLDRLLGDPAIRRQKVAMRWVRAKQLEAATVVQRGAEDSTELPLRRAGTATKAPATLSAPLRSGTSYVG